MKEYTYDTLNPYASPEPVNETPDMFSRPGQENFRGWMNAVRGGIGWVLLGLLMPPVVVIVALILGPLSIAVLAAIPIMQLWGMWKCRECPEDIVPYARELIYASAGFYLACPILFFLAFPPLAGQASDWLIFFSLASLGFSGVTWQIFLLRLSREMESWWLASTAWGMLAVYVLGGFAMLIISYILSVTGTIWWEAPIPPANDYERFLREIYPKVAWTAIVAGLIYGVMYLAVLIGLRWEIRHAASNE